MHQDVHPWPARARCSHRRSERKVAVHQRAEQLGVSIENPKGSLLFKQAKYVKTFGTIDSPKPGWSFYRSEGCQFKVVYPGRDDPGPGFLAGRSKRPSPGLPTLICPALSCDAIIRRHFWEVRTSIGTLEDPCKTQERAVSVWLNTLENTRPNNLRCMPRHA